jgi:hypothetical protein
MFKKEVSVVSTYPQRVVDNILPLSISGSLPEAFKEWYFTEHTIDHESPIEKCELCDQEELRYHFEIEYRFTNHTLMVGSQCILKFQLSVYENGLLLDDKDTNKKLESLKNKMRLESCINALAKVSQAENNEILRKALDFYNKNQYLTPKFAFVVLWRLQKNEIDHNPSFFKINLRKDKYKQDLKNMELSRVHLIWPALSSSQRRMAENYGHTEPRKT